MMQRLADDPAFWLSVWTLIGLLFTATGALLGLLIAWARAKTAEVEARSAQQAAGSASASQVAQQQTLTQHTAAIAALQATTQSVVPAAALPVPGMPTETTNTVGLCAGSVRPPVAEQDG